MHFPKAAKIACERIPIQENSVVGVDSSDGIIYPIVEIDHTRLGGVRGFIEGVVPGNPGITFVMFGELFPEPDGSVLVVFVKPESGDVRTGVGVPVGVLSTGS